MFLVDYHEGLSYLQGVTCCDSSFRSTAAFFILVCLILLSSVLELSQNRLDRLRKARAFERSGVRLPFCCAASLNRLITLRLIPSTRLRLVDPSFNPSILFAFESSSIFLSSSTSCDYLLGQFGERLSDHFTTCATLRYVDGALHINQYKIGRQFRRLRSLRLNHSPRWICQWIWGVCRWGMVCHRCSRPKKTTGELSALSLQLLLE